MSCPRCLGAETDPGSASCSCSDDAKLTPIDPMEVDAILTKQESLRRRVGRLMKALVERYGLSRALVMLHVGPNRPMQLLVAHPEPSAVLDDVHRWYIERAAMGFITFGPPPPTLRRAPHPSPQTMLRPFLGAISVPLAQPPIGALLLTFGLKTPRALQSVDALPILTTAVDPLAALIRASYSSR